MLKATIANKNQDNIKEETVKVTIESVTLNNKTKEEMKKHLEELHNEHDKIYHVADKVWNRVLGEKK